MELFERGAVIITGAGKGIGRATAVTSAQEGLAVAAWDRDSAALDDLVSVIGAAGGSAKGFVVDVGDAAAVGTALDASFAFGDCRYLVNNAGPLSRPTSPMTFEEGLMLSMGSVYQVTTGWLKRAGDDAEAVVSLSSISGTTWAGGASDIYYPVGKSAIAAYMKEIAVRHRGRPRANAVAPGGTITARTQDHINAPPFSCEGGALGSVMLPVAWTDGGAPAGPAAPPALGFEELVALAALVRALATRQGE